MKISCIEIQNFRKLKSSRIDLGEKETVFVGANNSGKTSAMEALILFLNKNRRKEIETTDFTLSNWHMINEIGDTWAECDEPENLNLDVDLWFPIVPSLDVWLDVADSEIHYVSHLIPTLSWRGGKLGVRLCFEPKSKDNRTEVLYKEFKKAFESAKETSSKSQDGKKLSLWPKSLKEFLEKGKYLQNYFSVKAYLLDPSKFTEPIDGKAIPQDLPENSVSLDIEPFKGLFKIDIINAQRGFSDAKTSDSSGTGNKDGNLTSQLRSYFDKHLDPSEQPNEDDLDALFAIENATNEFDKKLKSSFSSAISELESLGYPGFSDPQITLTSKINPVEGLNHDSAVRFNLTDENDTSGRLGTKAKLLHHFIFNFDKQ